MCVVVWLWACEADVPPACALGSVCFWVCSRALSSAAVPSLPLHKVEDDSKPLAKADSGVHMESASSGGASMSAVCAVLVPELAHFGFHKLFRYD